MSSVDCAKQRSQKQRAKRGEKLLVVTPVRDYEQQLTAFLEEARLGKSLLYQKFKTKLWKTKSTFQPPEKRVVDRSWEVTGSRIVEMLNHLAKLGHDFKGRELIVFGSSLLSFLRGAVNKSEIDLFFRPCPNAQKLVDLLNTWQEEFLISDFVVSGGRQSQVFEFTLLRFPDWKFRLSLSDPRQAPSFGPNHLELNLTRGLLQTRQPLYGKPSRKRLPGSNAFLLLRSLLECRVGKAAPLRANPAIDREIDLSQAKDHEIRQRIIGGIYEEELLGTLGFSIVGQRVKLEQGIDCPVELEPVKSGVRLGCGHSLGLDSLYQIVRRAGPVQDKCPCCRGNLVLATHQDHLPVEGSIIRSTGTLNGLVVPKERGRSRVMDFPSSSDDSGLPESISDSDIEL
jgi:hypothetical protein